MEVPEVGKYVIVRKRPGIIRNVVPIEDTSEGRLNLVEVDYVDGYEHPAEDRLIWERELNANVLKVLDNPAIDDPASRPDEPDRFESFINALRWTSNTRFWSDVKGVHCERLPILSPWFCSVQVEDYQLFPVLQALSMPRVNMLLADDVGLGKTIEAGLIVQELIRQRRIRRIMVICPSSLQVQWQDEMREKFNLDFTILDSEQVYSIQRELGMDANPWTVHPRIITSMDYLKQQDVWKNMLRGSESLLSKASAMLPWDLLIVDEAHNFSPRFRDQSERYTMLKNVTLLFEHHLFLTATPHNGYTVSFTGLLELLDPIRFQQKTKLNEDDRKQLQLVMVRRMKEELNQGRERPRFAKRGILGIHIELTPVEVNLYQEMRRYRLGARKELARIGKKERILGEFLFTLLTKRLLSSSYAFARTWWNHVEGFDLEGFGYEDANKSRERAEQPVAEDDEKDQREIDAVRHGAAWLKRYSKTLEGYIRAVSTALEENGWTLEATRQPLDRMTALPEDRKWDRLLEWVRKNLQQGKRFHPDERLIVFTEYKDTMNYLIERFRRERITAPALQTLYGGAEAKVRQSVKEQFNDPTSDLRILVATDAASEGLNLQTSCRYVIHQEIPWNPMRMEQRNGRVDRHGQYRDVTVHHFVSDQIEDLKFLDYVARKVHTVRDELGSVGKVLDETVMDYFALGNVDTKEVDRRVKVTENVAQDRADLKSRVASDEKNYEDSIREYETTRRWLHLNEDNIAQLLSEAVVLDGGEVTLVSDGVRSFSKVPPRWKRLVETSLLLKEREFAGAQPKMVFSPDRIEVVENGFRLFRPLKDTNLLMLGHPIMERSLTSFRRRLWMPSQESKINRWTLAGGRLPPEVASVFVFSFIISVRNKLGERLHHGLMEVPLTVSCSGTCSIDYSLLDIPSSRLAEEEMKERITKVRHDWMKAVEAANKLKVALADEIEKKTERDLADALQRQKKELDELYDLRRRSLLEGTDKRSLDKLRRELEEAEEKAKQMTFSDELNEENQQYFKEVKAMFEDAQWERQRAPIEAMIERLDLERTRFVEKVLPNRYTIAEGGVDVQTAAVRVVINDGGA
ncbi:MAG: ATP-dependent helicase HepA [Methanomassiliicoccales archaeon PtaU1.Bin030]|nr:MAG: ATP-dependent helicase HepA [Methanomassiliicoccales archaeon PtaU1.Bin030]